MHNCHDCACILDIFGTIRRKNLQVDKDADAKSALSTYGTKF